ncbi:ABC transporter ATP-binding protein [Prolixibacteraceae bacterium JC049]|nr:ABC transporter ATP-binding protein [Prolixibacteraceae bacterium JC049]
MISINNLTFNYRKQSELFSSLNLEMKDGSITGLLGKNGAGKSTLLKMIAGLLHPHAGEISVDGMTPKHRYPDFLADVFLVPEEFAFPSISIQTYVKASAVLYPNFDMEKLERVLNEFELDVKKNLNKMSHGQRKKFLIAFALATNCKLLLLDEPTNGLDIPSKSLFRKVLVSSINDDQLVLISTHQVKDIENIIDQLVIVDDGKLILQSDTWKITERYQFRTLPAVTDDMEAIYSEKCLGGYRAILPTENGEETDIDIELLFNAIVNNAPLKLTDHVE